MSHEYLKDIPLNLLRFFGHLIGVQGGDSGGKSVSMCDPAESVANELCTIRWRRVTAGA
jgi:hypothetical protein